jgi:hypothetical protein
MGCLCWMPFAIWAKDKDCWIFVVTEGDTKGMGWPNELNGSVLNERDNTNGIRSPGEV